MWRRFSTNHQAPKHSREHRLLALEMSESLPVQSQDAEAPHENPSEQAVEQASLRAMKGQKLIARDGENATRDILQKYETANLQPAINIPITSQPRQIVLTKSGGRPITVPFSTVQIGQTITVDSARITLTTENSLSIRFSQPGTYFVNARWAGDRQAPLHPPSGFTINDTSITPSSTDESALPTPDVRPSADIVSPRIATPAIPEALTDVTSLPPVEQPTEQPALKPILIEKSIPKPAAGEPTPEAQTAKPEPIKTTPVKKPAPTPQKNPNSQNESTVKVPVERNIKPPIKDRSRTNTQEVQAKPNTSDTKPSASRPEVKKFVRSQFEQLIRSDSRFSPEEKDAILKRENRRNDAEEAISKKETKEAALSAAYKLRSQVSKEIAAIPEQFADPEVYVDTEQKANYDSQVETILAKINDGFDIPYRSADDFRDYYNDEMSEKLQQQRKVISQYQNWERLAQPLLPNHQEISDREKYFLVRRMEKTLSSKSEDEIQKLQIELAQSNDAVVRAGTIDCKKQLFCLHMQRNAEPPAETADMKEAIAAIEKNLKQATTDEKNAFAKYAKLTLFSPQNIEQNYKTQANRLSNIAQTLQLEDVAWSWHKLALKSITESSTLTHTDANALEPIGNRYPDTNEVISALSRVHTIDNNASLNISVNSRLWGDIINKKTNFPALSSITPEALQNICKAGTRDMYDNGNRWLTNHLTGVTYNSDTVCKNENTSLNLSALTSLSKEHARALQEYHGERISLEKVTEISADTAEELRKCVCKTIIVSDDLVLEPSTRKILLSGRVVFVRKSGRRI